MDEAIIVSFRHSDPAMNCAHPARDRVSVNDTRYLAPHDIGEGDKAIVHPRTKAREDIRMFALIKPMLELDQQRAIKQIHWTKNA